MEHKRRAHPHLDRNPIEEIGFRALMHKLFHLSSFDNLDLGVSLRNLPAVSTECVRMYVC